MRRAARTDANHRAIAAALRQIGATVVDLAGVGAGCPDLLVGFQGRTVLVEVKRPPGPRGGTKDRTLTPGQTALHTAWRGGPLAVVTSVDEALAAIAAR